MQARLILLQYFLGIFSRIIFRKLGLTRREKLLSVPVLVFLSIFPVKKLALRVDGRDHNSSLRALSAYTSSQDLVRCLHESFNFFDV